MEGFLKGNSGPELLTSCACATYHMSGTPEMCPQVSTDVQLQTCDVSVQSCGVSCVL